MNKLKVVGLVAEIGVSSVIGAFAGIAAYKATKSSLEGKKKTCCDFISKDISVDEVADSI